MIKDRKKMSQIKDFSTLPTGATDIDGLIEYHNKCFILMESKHGDKVLPTGQRMALERVCDSLNKPAIVFIGSHTCSAEIDIDYGGLDVREYYFQGEWKHFDKPVKMFDAVRYFIKGYGHG